MSRHRALTHCLAALASITCAAVLPSCSISPQPEPPVSMDLGKVGGEVRYLGLTVTVHGRPGAVRPAGAILRAYNLDSTGPAVDTTVATDGSFLLDVDDMDIGKEVRLQVISDLGRSHPIDLVMTGRDGSLSPAVRPLSDCLELLPDREFDVGSSEGISIRNRCTADVVFLAPRMRTPIDGLLIDGGAPSESTLAPDAQLTVRIEAAPGSASFEEILFIEASQPQRDRRPITARFIAR